MGWTDNGKIMPPWITLSEQRKTESEGGERGMQVQGVGQVEKLCLKSFIVHGAGTREMDGEGEGYRLQRVRVSEEIKQENI